MACEGCTQKLLIEQNNKVHEEAESLANSIGKWVAIYRDESGSEKHIVADQAGQYPVIRYISPKLQNNTNRNTV